MTPKRRTCLTKRVYFFRIRLVIYKFKLTVNGDADEPHDVGYAYDYCAAQCPRIRKIIE